MENDPCLDYVELDEPDRSAGFMFTGFAKNDFTIPANWYRSISGAGGNIPPGPLSLGQCNALAPIYLTGR